MKLLIIQLSDIHFCIEKNYVLEKEEELFNAIKNEALGCDEIVILNCGDSAFSGNNAEYEIAYKFFNSLHIKLSEYTKKNISTIVVPGNHDCDFFEKDNQARRNQVKSIQTFGDSAIDDTVINDCTSVQQEYFNYANKLISSWETIYSSPLLNIYKKSIEQKNLLFYCYNSSYISELKEQAGKLYFPISILQESLFNNKADLCFSVFHHPFNWYNPNNRREFASHIYKTSDFFFTGHEHESSKYQIDDLNDNYIYHVEGSVLQESEDKFKSEFNLISFKLEDETFSVTEYYWDNNRYISVDKKEEWKKYKRGKFKVVNKYSLQKDFDTLLNDAGGNFTHRNKETIFLSDIYVYPKIRQFNNTENVDEEMLSVTIDSESIIKSIKPNTKLLFFGNENIGKTSLLKAAYKNLNSRGYLPILIDGHAIKSTAVEEFKKLVRKSFIAQYGNDSLIDFEQEDANNVFLLIDDFDKNPLKNQKQKGRFLKSINEYYSNIILIGNELMTIEEVIADEAVTGDLYGDFKQYEILEFNYRYKIKLIEKWYSIGYDDFMPNNEYYNKCDNAIKMIKLALGTRVVPNYPIFILILLQTVETANPLDIQASSYGNYYQLLILKTLHENVKEQSEQQMFQNYIAHLANHFFDSKVRYITKNEFIKFHNDIIGFYKLDLPHLSHERALSNLVKSGIIEEFDDSIEFKYLYTYYYFFAQYLATSLTIKERRKSAENLIRKICLRLYQSEFANIFMFLIHFTKDDFVLDELMSNARNVFNELAPCQLQDDVKNISDLSKEFSKLYFKNKTAEQVREEEAIEKEKIEEQQPQIINDKKSVNWDLDDDINNIDIVSKLNLSFKLIEVLGQIIKNNYGSIGGPRKVEMLKETYQMGLRTLNQFFTIINENTDFFLNALTSVLERSKNAEDEKVEKTARRLLFGFCSQFSYILIKKISAAVGTSRLSDKYDLLESEMNYSSVKLINFLIKLEHIGGFPEKNMRQIKSDIEKFPFAYYTFRRMILNHISRNQIDYKDKQRIFQFLGISMETQFRLKPPKNES